MSIRAMGWMRASVFLCVVLAGAGLQAQPPGAPRMPPPPAGPLALHTPVPLWANGAPGSEGKTAAETETVTADYDNDRRVATIHNPSLTPYLVRGAKTPTAAVIIAPGGGHQFLSIDMEGYDVAKYLSGHGVAAFVLKYRLSREKGSTYTMDNEVADAQRAIRLLRTHAAEWNVDPDRIGMMGFSAGGELTVRTMESFQEGGSTPGAASAATSTTADAVDSQSDKLDFMALMYPGSISTEMIAKMNKDTPPAFLLCGADDRPNISQQLALLFIALRQAGVPAELHEYTGVGHGFGLRLSARGGVADWPDLLVEWMQTKGFVR